MIRVLVAIALVAGGVAIGLVLGPAVNVWILTLRKPEPEPFDEPGGGW